MTDTELDRILEIPYQPARNAGGAVTDYNGLPHPLVEVRPILRYVPKRWGSERWLANTDAYCGKFLRIEPGRGTSLHYHKNKRETFYVMKGLLRLRLGTRAQRTELLLPYQAFDLPANLPHRLECAGEEPVLVLEISSHHEDADSYRVSLFGEDE